MNTETVIEYIIQRHDDRGTHEERCFHHWQEAFTALGEILDAHPTNHAEYDLIQRTTTEIILL